MLRKYPNSSFGFARKNEGQMSRCCAVSWNTEPHWPRLNLCRPALGTLPDFYVMTRSQAQKILFKSSLTVRAFDTYSSSSLTHIHLLLTIVSGATRLWKKKPVHSWGREARWSWLEPELSILNSASKPLGQPQKPAISVSSQIHGEKSDTGWNA